MRQKRDARQEQDQNRDDGAERPLRENRPGFAKQGNAVRDRLHARHRRAAVRECPQQNPEARRLGGHADGGGRDDRRWVPVAGDAPRKTQDHDVAQRHHEQVSREHERGSGFTNAAQIDQCHDGQDGQAQGQRVGQQRGNGRDQGAHAGRNADGNVQNVVERQRRPRQQRESRAQILFRHRVGAAPAGVSGDGLPIRHEDHQQNRDDHGDQRSDEGKARGTERDQHRQGGLGAVGRG